jgi:hypothetical protein
MHELLLFCRETEEFELTDLQRRSNVVASVCSVLLVAPSSIVGGTLKHWWHPQALVVAPSSIGGGTLKHWWWHPQALVVAPSSIGGTLKHWWWHPQALPQRGCRVHHLNGTHVLALAP